MQRFVLQVDFQKKFFGFCCLNYGAKCSHRKRRRACNLDSGAAGLFLIIQKNLWNDFLTQLLLWNTKRYRGSWTVPQLICWWGDGNTENKREARKSMWDREHSWDVSEPDEDVLPTTNCTKVATTKDWKGNHANQWQNISNEQQRWE